MGENATCPKCGNQEWHIDTYRVTCAHCGRFFLLHEGIPSNEVMRLINDPNYGTLRVTEGKEV